MKCRNLSRSPDCTSHGSSDGTLKGPGMSKWAVRGPEPFVPKLFRWTPDGTASVGKGPSRDSVHLGAGLVGK